MKKIAIIKSQPSTYFGGKEKQLATLASAWQGYGKKVILYTNCKILNSDFQKRELKTKKIWLGCEPVKISDSLLFTFLLPFLIIYAFSFTIFLKFKKIDSIYLIDIPEKILLTIPSRLLGINVIWEEFNTLNWGFSNPYRILWILLSRIAKVFTYSDTAKNLLTKKGISKKINVIYPGINFAELKNQESLFNALAEQNLQNKQLFKIGTFCYLSKQNGLEYLLQALKIIIEIVPEAQLIIIGSGEERFDLNWLVRKLGLDKHIWFMGYEENYYYWLKSFDLFVMPTLKTHSLNLAIIEAMAHFCPVVASNVEEINELVKHNLAGILVEPANPEILAQAIISLYRNPKIRNQMGENAQNRVKTLFNIDRVIEDFENFI